MDKARFYPKKPMLLKDYLLDDFGSCSSSGFKSFPRRQCCSSVPAFLESDPKRKRRGKGNGKRRLMSFQKASALSSAFRSVFTAVRRLPLAAGWRSDRRRRRDDAALGSGGWRRKLPEERKEIARWKSFDQLLKEDSRSPDGSYRWPAAVSRFTAECSISGGGRDSVDVNLETVTVEPHDGAAAETREAVVTNDDVSVESTTASDGSISSTNPKIQSIDEQQKQWVSDQEIKEQFSPISVLDCPFDDEDEEVSSPFQQRLARMEGTKRKLMKKIHMLESLAKLEPLNLTTRFTSKPDSDNGSSSCTDEKTIFDFLKAEEKESATLLYRIKSTLSTSNNDDSSNDKLLLDFFRKGIPNQSDQPPNYEKLLKEAQDWLDRQRPNGMALDWSVETSQAAYVEDMERGGEWKKLDQEMKEVASMLESEVFGAFLDELLVDMISIM